MARPLVSIIIPCFNAGPMLERSLGSCSAQTYRGPLEIILVDNNSTDGSRDQATEIARLRGLPLRSVTCAVQGGNHARNMGLGLANGEYVQWLDADDELSTTKIADQVDALEEHRAYDIAYSDFDIVILKDGSPSVTYAYESAHYDDYIMQLLVQNWRPAHCFLLRRSAAKRLDELNGWHPATTCAQDREYFTLAALLGLKFLYVAGGRVQYNQWSPTQVGVRGRERWLKHRTLDAIFTRLRELVARHPPATLTAAHAPLLEQSFEPTSVVPFSVLRADSSSNAGAIEVRKDQTGERITLTRPELIILCAARSRDTADSLERHAAMAVRTIYSASRILRPDVEPAETEAEVDRLLEVEERHRFASPRLLENLDLVPPFITPPIWGTQRYRCFTHVSSLRAKGLFSPAE